MRTTLLMLAIVMSSPCHAYDGLTSELSHAAGGALLAGAVARAFDESGHRACIGFAVSAAATLAAEYPGLASQDETRAASSRLDVRYHVVGAALGAWAADRYFLKPLVTPTYVGVVYQRAF